MAKYGNDKPDLRFGLEHVELTDVWSSGTAPRAACPHAPRGASQQEGIVKALVVPAAHPLSRAEADKLEEVREGHGRHGPRPRQGRRGRRVDAVAARQDHHPGAARGDQRGLRREARRPDPASSSGRPALVHTVMANLRVHVAKKLGLIPEYGTGGQWKLLWVVEPAALRVRRGARSAGSRRTTPSPARSTSDVQYLETDPGRVKCYRYDVVLNGFEIGGGSIRLHDPEVQARGVHAPSASARRRRGRSSASCSTRSAPARRRTAASRWAWIGSPCCSPSAESLRDVIPFPKTKTGTDQMTGAPGEVDEQQLARAARPRRPAAEGVRLLQPPLSVLQRRPALDCLAVQAQVDPITAHVLHVVESDAELLGEEETLLDEQRHVVD